LVARHMSTLPGEDRKSTKKKKMGGKERDRNLGRGGGNILERGKKKINIVCQGKKGGEQRKVAEWEELMGKLVN